MITQLLYPLTFPLEDNDRFVYLTALKSLNRKNIIDLIRNYHIFIDIEIPITKTEIMIMSLKVLRKLDKDNANPILKYKVMYHNTENNLRIRSDNGHIENGQRYPHIDLEMPNLEHKKMVFDTDPSDYEASINTVLRYAERYSNPMVGINYWLRNLVVFRTDLIYYLFNNQKQYLGTSTAFTDVARLVSADIWTNERETIYDFEALNKLTAPQFVSCWKYEQTKQRPLKISKNLIQQKANMNLFPCPIYFDSPDGPLKHRVFDSRGNELSNDCVHLLGKTTYENRN